MTLFPNRHSSEGDLEARLSAGRPEPSHELVDNLVASIDNRHKRGRPLRTILAVSFSAAILGALSAFGGIGYAESHTNHFVHHTFSHNENGENHSSADDQYRPGKGCGDDNHTHVPKPGQSPCPPESDH